MVHEQTPTETFRDLWLPPVETAAELPTRPGESAMCFVTSERRVWVCLEGKWAPAPAPKLRAVG